MGAGGKTRRVCCPQSHVFKKWYRKKGSYAADLSGMMQLRISH